MRTTLRILTSIMAALLVLTGGAAATDEPCPECDEDREPGVDSSFSSVDAGAVTDEAVVLADTDASVSNSDNEQGFWAWLSICLTAWVGAIEDALGVESDTDANVEAFVSEDGIDVDATARVLGETVDLEDDTPLGDVDDATWDAMGELDLDIDSPVNGEDIPDIDEDLCVHADLQIAC